MSTRRLFTRRLFASQLFASQLPNGPRPRRGLVACPWLLAALLAVPGLAMALGLGQIVVKSQPGQPLLAEIPIIAANPAELEDLKVRLASPETFRRVGLPQPGAAVATLQFMVAVDAQGRPVIRVTSPTPPSQPLLTFLLEVDWGEGRLVREYSALLDAPQTVAAPVQAIQAPAVAPANTIEWAPPAVVAPSSPAAAPTAGEPAILPAPEPEVVAEALPAEPPPPNVATTEPEVVAAPVPAPVPPPAASTGNDYIVRAGDTLSGIASRRGHADRSLDQAMLALLHANPDAFIGGNVNLVKQGAVLRMPQSDELSRYSAGEAAAMVRAQVAQWREARSARQQPGPIAAAVVAAVPASGRDDGAPPQASTEARLAIVPPSSGSGEAGTRSGIQAGGEGRMLRQEIQQTQETLAARDAELGELRTRVVELEKIQQQQQQLIAMKDSALAAARENLVKANTAQPVATPQPVQASGPVLWPWLLLGLALVLVGTWWFLRRRGAAPRPRLFDSAAMAASMPKAEPTPPPTPEPVVPPPAPQPPHWTAAPALVGTVPATRLGGPDAPAGFERDEALTPARQVELARAYLDLGDDAAARELLREVLDGYDPVAREIAARMLQELE